MRALVVIALLLVGCEDVGEARPDVARQRETFVFENPRADIVDALRGVLAEQGYELIENRGDTMRTRARPDGHEYVAHFLELKKAHGCVVQLVHVTRNPDGTVASSYRDLEREWELIQRADPDAAIEMTAR